MKKYPIEKIIKDYTKNNFKINKLSEKYKLCRSTISKILKDNSLYIPKKHKRFDYSVMTKDLLYELYIIKKMSSREMMDYFNITNHKVMRKIMIGFGIPTNNKRRRGEYFVSHEEISPNYWSSIGRAAIKRGFEFSITIEYAWDLFLKQEKKCAISGLPIKFSKYKYVKEKQKKQYFDSDQSASLDRIDSSKGYIEGNVQWLNKHINLMKKDYSQKDFIEICKIIAENNK